MVRKIVGRTTSSATPTIHTVNRSATTSPIRSAAMREKRKTVIEKARKRSSGSPVKAIWAVRKTYFTISIHRAESRRA